MSNRLSLAAVVLTYNEAPNIRHCLESIRGLCDVYVVDSGSDDGTVEICREYTDRIAHHPYQNHSNQWRWALENLAIDAEWILALDADYRISADLRARLERDLSALPHSVGGVYVRHLYVFGGGRIRFGGTKRHWLVLVRRARAKADLSDLVDFRFVVDGETVQWPEVLLEYNRHDDDISTWIRKQDKFALRLAVEEELRRAGRLGWQLQPRFFGGTNERIAWLRDRWLALPLFVRPVIYFLYRYILAGGFLDGRGGFLYHALQGFWLRILVDWKICELRRLGLHGEALQAFSKRMLESRSGSVGEILDKTSSCVNSAPWWRGDHDG